jgi:outer membrane protein TolC
MNHHHTIIGLLLLTTAAYICGCERPDRDTAFYALNVPREKTRKIDSFELETHRTPAPPAVPSVLELPEIPLEKIDLGLDQCRAMALENNLSLKVQLLAPTIAREQVNAERAKFEASFVANVNYYKIDQPTAVATTIQSSQGETGQVDLGVEVPLQTGGKVTFNLADDRRRTNLESLRFNPSYENDFSVSISQPLLRGAGVRINTHSIRIAEYDKQITDARTKLEVISVISAMDRVYWRLYAAYKQLEVRKQQHDLAKAQLQRAERFVEAGQQARIEIDRAEAGLAQSLESIIIAQNNLSDRQRELKRTLNKSGLQLQGPTAIVPATEPNPIHYTFQTNQLVDQAIGNRMEMLELELQIAKNISNIDYLRNQALPLVTMNYTYNINGLGPTRSDSLDLLQDNNFSDHIIGLKLLVPLGNKAAESTLRAAYYTRMQTLASKENRQKIIEVEVLDALDQLESNWQRILAARQNSILQERLYQAEIRQFENGLTTSTDVLEAQTNFANAQSTEINALAEYQIALVDLAYASGTLLGAAQVEWEPIVPAIP